MSRAIKLTILSALILIFTIGIFMYKEMKPVGSLKLKMGFPSRLSITNFDTMSITSIYHYELLRNLYGRLVRYNQDGQIVPDIPEKFYWQNGTLIFEFGKKATTIDGYIITAEDAAASLKRNIIYKKTGHGDIRNFLCPGHELKNISDTCVGIAVVDTKLVLKPIKEHYGPLLLTALENVDYSIIPKTSLDKSLKITDYKNTSGPYFVINDSPVGEIKLQANSKHYLYSENMPQEIDLVPSIDNDIWDFLLEDKIDFIPIGILPAGEKSHLALNNKMSYNTHKSIPISVLMLIFSKDAIEEFSAEQRFFVANLFSKAVKENLIFFEVQPTETFFSKHSNGGLSDEQNSALKNIRNNANRPAFKQPIEIGVSEARVEFFSQQLSEYKNEIKFIGLKTSPLDLKTNERPHVIIMTNDSAWLEDMGLIGYNLNFDVFKTMGLEKDIWIENYLSKESKEDRNKMLQELHYENLINAYIYPILVSPYFAIIKKPWVFNMSTLHAGTELWNIKIP